MSNLSITSGDLVRIKWIPALLRNFCYIHHIAKSNIAKWLMCHAMDMQWSSCMGNDTALWVHWHVHQLPLTELKSENGGNKSENGQKEWKKIWASVTYEDWQCRRGTSMLLVHAPACSADIRVDAGIRVTLAMTLAMTLSMHVNGSHSCYKAGVADLCRPLIALVLGYCYSLVPLHTQCSFLPYSIKSLDEPDESTGDDSW